MLKRVIRKINCITELFPTATVTPEELLRLDSVESVDFTGATYTYDGDGEAIHRIAFLNCFSSSHHDYVARWYDPVLAHFAQADTIIPQPGNAGDWNRYAYVLYNPANFNDPSGHYADDIWDFYEQYKSEALRNEITTCFGWDVSDQNLSLEILDNILKAGAKISEYIESLDSSIDGNAWIRKYLGSTYFKARNVEARVNFVFPKDIIRLTKDASVSTIVHDLGHVLDNNLKKGIGLATFSGGSIADDLLLDIGIKPQSTRCSIYQGDTHYWFYQELEKLGMLMYYIDDKGSFSYDVYGNYGQADYFADAWEYTQSWDLYM